MTISPGGTRREVDGHHGDAFRSSYAAPHVVSDGHHIDSRASRVVSSGHTGYSSEGRVELTIKSANFFKDSDSWGKQDPFI